VLKGWSKPLKSVLIGCGKMAHSYATIIDGHPDLKLSAVIDVNPEAARAFGASFGCTFFTSVDQYLAGNNLADCGIVCTPPSGHAEIACQLMQRGMSVLCEKPFALDSTEAGKMLQLSRTFGVQLMMGSKFRYVSDIIHARGLIQAGILGQMLSFEIDFRDMVDMRNRWNIKPEISGGGVLIDSGSLAVDVVRYLFGPVMGVRAEEARRIQSNSVEDTARMELRTESGVIGTINLSWTIRNTSDDYIRVYGTQGNLCIGWKKSRYRPHGAVDWVSFGEGYNTLKALSRQMSNFVEVVVEDGIPEAVAEDGFESVSLIEMAYVSMRTGAWQTLSPGHSATGTERKLSLLRSGENRHPAAISPSS
jgi:predicted dehydrogenase